MKRLSSRVIGCAIEVHKTLGAGFLESVYETALEIEFLDKGLRFERQAPLDVWYSNHRIGKFVADFIVEGRMVLELKANQRISAANEAQMLNYLRATNTSVGLILNFGQPTLQVKRKVLNYDE